MSNLLNVFKGLMSDNVVGQLSSLVGGNSSMVKTALTSMMPSLLKGIASKGGTEAGASSLLSMIKDHDLGGDLASSLGDKDASAALMEKGGKLNSAIFGDGLDKISVPGLGGDAKSKLMSLVTPMMLGSIGKVANTQNLDAKGLSSMLQSQASGLTSGLATGAAGLTGAKKTVEAATAKATTMHTEAKASGGMLKWLVLVAVLAGLGWFFTRPATTTTAETPAVTTEQKAAPATSTGHTHNGHTHTHADGTVHNAAHEEVTQTTTNAAVTNAKDAATGTVTSAAGAATGAMTNAKDAVTGAVTSATDATGAVTNATGAATDAIANAKDAATGAMANAKDAATEAMTSSAAAMAAKTMGLTLDPEGNLLKGESVLLKAGEFSVKDGKFLGKDGEVLDLMKKLGGAAGDASGTVGKTIGKAVGGH